MTAIIGKCNPTNISHIKIYFIMIHLENDYEQLKIANDITLSDQTKKIIGCIAYVGDTLGIATDYAYDTYKEDIDDLIKGFTEAWNAYNVKLNELLAYVISQQL